MGTRHVIPGREPLPVHFLTIVLNGEPYIRHHIEQFQQLPFPWHWHVVEGVASLVRDTGWSVKNGGRIPEELHRDGLSTDGTTQYLNDLVKKLPRRISVYRKLGGKPWPGKTAMVNRPLRHILRRALLWQVDVDELWTTAQIVAARRLFLDFPRRMSAGYRCWFFVGPRLVLARNARYGNPPQGWRRTWRFEPGMRWRSHEPPRLVKRAEDGSWLDLRRARPFTPEETEAAGLVFQHHAYTRVEQVRFKESYYGYAGAVDQWHALQRCTTFPARAADYLAWIRDDTLVEPLPGDVVPIM